MWDCIEISNISIGIIAEILLGINLILIIQIKQVLFLNLINVKDKGKDIVNSATLLQQEITRFS